MSNIAIFAAQIVTALGYIITLFALYRLLVSQKDATIESLRQQIDFLNVKLDAVEAESPSVLAKSLSEQVELLTNQLERLRKDRSQDQDLIEERENELAQVRKKIDDYKQELEEAEAILSEYKCPHCGADLSEKLYLMETVEYEGRDIDIDYEVIRYECGLEMINGEMNHPCSSTQI